MNFKAISRNIGIALLVSAFFMLLSIFVSVIRGNDSALAALIISFTITFTVGIFPFIFVRNSSNITLTEGYVTVFLAWLMSFTCGMLPYLLWGGPFTVANAWFESVSGFTTCGATVLDNIEALPDSLLFWRSSTHFIGGLGVAVYLLLVIPNSSPVRMRFANFDVSTVGDDGYRVRTNHATSIFAYVYFGIFAAAFLCYVLAGMPVFDAINHAFTVCATGGFSIKNLSIGAYDSRLIEGITMFFMFIASCHFGITYFVIVTRSLKPLKNPVFKFYLLCIAAVVIISSISLSVSGTVDSYGKALWYALFHTLSISSTSGLAITDNLYWPPLANYVILVMGIMCGCAGSTSGGIKADRVLMVINSISRQVRHVIHPTSVNEVRMGRRIVPEEDIKSQTLYVSLYGITLLISAVLCLAIGLSPENAFTGSLASLSNLGPSVGQLSTYGNYNALPAAAKFIFSFDMFMGRVEIYPILAVFALMYNKVTKYV